MALNLTEKQKEFIRNSNHRFNIKVGATRSGKTYLDIIYTIPARLRERHGKDGLNVIMGVSRTTIERNILQPLRERWGKDLVGVISNITNMTTIFGEEVYCLGAEKISQVSKIRGASVKYCYCDELAEYNKEVFELLKSRLDKPYSLLDATLNPEGEMHWLKQEFLNEIEEKEIDAYVQTYTIFDNTFLTKEFVTNLCKEYAGTVYYDRYILGLWKNAEGLVYKRFADNPDSYKLTYVDEFKNGEWVDNLPKGDTIIGIDYGGTKSGQAFVCTRISYDYSKVITLASWRITDLLDSKQLLDKQMEFIDYCRKKFHCEIDSVYPDNEESVHIRSLANAVQERGLPTVVRGCKKCPINDRIETQNKMIAFNVWKYVDGECNTLVTALRTALWDDTKIYDERLDNFTTDIDSLDAYEYSIERDMKRIIDAINYEEVI